MLLLLEDQNIRERLKVIKDKMSIKQRKIRNNKNRNLLAKRAHTFAPGGLDDAGYALEAAVVTGPEREN